MGKTKISLRHGAFKNELFYLHLTEVTNSCLSVPFDHEASRRYIGEMRKKKKRDRKMAPLQSATI